MIKIISFLLLVVSFMGQAQPINSLSGKVTDIGSKPLAGVAVHLLNTHFGAATNELGDFTIEKVPDGKYVMQITAVGYASKCLDVNIAAGTHADFNFQLEESTTQLDHAIVTAQKQEEDMQKVPFTVSTISSKQVQQYRLWNSRDITAIVPNLYSTNSGDNRNVTSIRGITTTSYDPAVATYIDGVNQFGLDTYIAQLFDIERIEVLSGPQGTLYGRNAMAGAINIITKQPTNTTTGFAELNVGNYGQQRYAIGLRTPLLKNKLYAGVTGVFDGNSGFYTNQFNNANFDSKHSFIGNYFLKYNANERWALTLNVKHANNRNNGAFPLAGSRDEAFDEPFTVNQNAVTKMVDNIFNTSLVANYAGRAFNFSSQTSYQSNYRYYENPIDGDFSAFDIVTIINNYGDKWNHVKVFTQELKLSSPASSSSAVKWTAGTYLFYQNNPTKQATRFGENGDVFGYPINSSSINTNKSESKGIAFFGQATYSVAGKIDLTVGLRYDYENKKQSVLVE